MAAKKWEKSWDSRQWSVHWLYTKSVTWRLMALSALFFVAFTGCRSVSSTDSKATSGQTSKIYKLRGKVIRTDAERGEATIDHQAIPGFMEAMTMPYKLKDIGVLGELHPGDVITADVLVFPDPNADYLLDHIVVVAQAKPDYLPKVAYHVPTAGDAVPDFKLRNQDGHPVHLGQYKGKALLITFLYTRCPSPNFCPWVTRAFATVNKQLAANPALFAKTHLLCVTFDPDNDTPERLKAYGASYMGDTSFAHWDFTIPEKPVLMEMAKYFDLGVTQGSDGTIVHTLSTTLVGPDGKVAHFYPGNEWTPEQVVADMKQLVL
jgi:protein SCO1/2